MKNRLTFRQVQEIASTLAPTEKKATAAHPVIWQTERDYNLCRQAAAENGSLQAHERRLASIEATARKLTQLLRSEPLIYQVLSQRVFIDGPVTNDALEKLDRQIAGRVEQDENDLIRILGIVENGAGRLADDPEELRSARFDASRKDAHKSMERRLLWVPIFHFCTENGIRLTFYENGSLFRALAMLHEAIDAPELKAGSLRRAIEEYVHEPSILDLDEAEIHEWQPEG